MAVADLNKVLYVDQDFSTAVGRIQEFLQTYYPNEYTDYINSNFGQALIDIIAYPEQSLMWYLNRRVSDLYFPTALTPSAISKIARTLGYKSKGASSAEVSVTVSLTEGPYSFPVTIQKGFQFNGPNGTIWEYRGNVPVIYAPGETVKTFNLSQGFTVTNNFVSSGDNNQIFQLRSVSAGKYVDATSVVVTVNTIEWDEYNVIPFQNIDAYETNLVASPPFIKFGDSVQGNIPEEGASIVATYFVTDGFRGRIISGGITGPVVQLVAQFQTIPLTISQPNPSVGGNDPEDIRSITVNAPLFQRTQDRAITKGDYDFLANQFVNVARADAKIVRGVSGDVFLNTMLPDILAAVSGAAIGIEAEGQVYIDQIEADSDLVIDAATDLADNIESGVDSSIVGISGSIDSALLAVDVAVSGSRTDIASSVVIIESSIKEINDEMIDLAEKAETEADVKLVSINTFSTAINNAVSGCGPAVIAQVASLTSSIISEVLSLQAAVGSRIATAASNIEVSTDDILAETATILAEMDSLFGDIDSSVLAPVSVAVSGMEYIRQVADDQVSGYIATVDPLLQDMNDQVSGLNSLFLDKTVGMYERVEYDVMAVSGYLDEHMSDPCKANLVQVSVLGKDSSRRYVAPLQSTLDELKDYLSVRKDITHTISTVAGVANVIDVDLRIEVRVNKNAIEDDVVKAIEDALIKSDVTPLGILVEREFNKSLYIWEIQKAIRDAVEDSEVDFVNIQIVGPTEYLDDDGNLIVPEGSVAQNGTLTIVKLPRY